MRWSWSIRIPTNALATGQSRTYKISLSPDATSQPLRVTLVWTDPPGNPVASVKLVNDLNLIVTNLDTPNLVYFGNDIASGNDFNQAWDTNTVPNVDMVNNVENVFLSPTLGINSQLGTNYSVTVVGSRVNVNAVTAQTNNVCQDYALVISSGDGQITNALTLNPSSPIVSSTQPLVTVITNTFANSPGFAGGVLFNQRVGANPQLLGTNTILLPTDANGGAHPGRDQPMAFLRHHQQHLLHQRRLPDLPAREPGRAAHGRVRAQRGPGDAPGSRH